MATWEIDRPGTTVSTAVFLAAAIVVSRRRGMRDWNSSALATLFRGEGLDREIKGRWNCGGSKALKDM